MSIVFFISCLLIPSLDDKLKVETSCGKLTCHFKIPPKGWLPLSFMFHRCERFSFCSRVTQQVRGVRATLVGNILLGNTVPSTHMKGDLCRSSHATPLPGRPCIRHTNYIRARETKR